jgi:hypothetical protein
MKFQREQAVIKALAELEIALSTFYNNDGDFEGLQYIYNQLKTYKDIL